jgi:protoporphyrinogen oxidase
VFTGGFTFDWTGHLLHLHTPYTKELIGKLLKGNLRPCVRKAAIYSKNVLTEYPFQINLHGLPERTVQKCVAGFLKAVQEYSDPKTRSTSLPLETWSRRTFGDGIHANFMKPYNEKLYRTKTTEMTAEWCGMFVPQPTVEDVLKGAKGELSSDIGYNASFLYPKKGGIQALPDAIGKDIPVQFHTRCVSIDWKAKKAALSDGSEAAYDSIVSSVPLPELLDTMKDLPASIRKAKKLLRWTSVLDVNLGIRRSGISDKSWIYFPEKEFIFYRVGFPMNFSPSVAPKGCSSMYVEISYKPGRIPDHKNPAFLKRVRKDLEKCGILRPSDKIAAVNIIPIPYAYVVYTPARKKAVSSIFTFLEKNGIHPVGRYGQWKYSFMEEAILDGKKAAETILAA